MELSVREAKARFSEALEAAARGERVVVTKHGKPFVEMGPVLPSGPVDWNALEAYRRGKGWDRLEWDWPTEFDDPAFSREVLGLGR